jgi:asparagine synthase (glutamine-hydrolysing)
VYWAIGDLIRSGHLPAACAALLDVLLRGGSFLFELRAARRYLPWSLGVRARVHQLLQPDFASRHAARATARPAGDTASQQALDVERLSLPVLLRYEDKNSMAHSIESRVPFLDHRLVEFCLGLPTDYKVKGSLTKRVMRKGLEGVVPEATLRRRSKLGFGGSYQCWVRTVAPQLLEWASVEDRPVFRFATPAAVRSLIRQSEPAVFRVLALATWLETFQIAP